MANKKARHSREAKQARRQKRLAARATPKPSIPLESDEGPFLALTDPLGGVSAGYVRLPPVLKVNEFLRRIESGEDIGEVELADPVLGQALRRRELNWIDDGIPGSASEPPNSLWWLDGSVPDVEEDPQPLSISVSRDGDQVQWTVSYPTEQAPGWASETYSSRATLLDSLDSWESQYLIET